MTKNIYLEVIESYYKGEYAKRTEIPYVNHIYEGLKILDKIGASQEVKDAYCLHPIYQVKKTEKELDYIKKYEPLFSDEVVFLAKEYRKTANSYLCKLHYKSENDLIKLSDYDKVNQMLVADKIQNRKDFELHYESQEDKEVFDRSENLSQYFKNWLKVLNVSEDFYQECKAMIS